MTAAVVDNLPLLAIAPGGVSQLRELILDLAANGRLGSTDVKWRATQLRELVVSSGAGWSPSCEARPRCSDEWGVLKVSAVSWGRFQPDENKALPKSLAPRPELEVQPGDFLVSRANTADLVARSVVVEDTPPKLMLSDKIVRLRLSEACDTRFIQIANSAPESRRYYARVAGGTSSSMKNVSREQILALPILLPPLAEQHRVVAKVDELMALCDRLEARQQDAETAHARLVQALLDSLTQVRDAEEFQACWQRVAGQLEGIFTTVDAIDRLKQTVLQLAVMGKFSRQAPADEHAELLMARLREARDSRYANGGSEDPEIRTMQRKLADLRPLTAPFPLPKGWTTISLIDCCLYLVDCHNKTAPYADRGIPIIRTSNIRERRFRMDDMRFVTAETYEFWSRRCPPQPGDIIFTREAPMGEAAIVPDGVTFCLGQRTMLIRPIHEFIDNQYLLIALTEPHLLERASAHAIGSTVKHLRVGDVEQLAVPLPPLAEQRRIVAKVTELLTLCDQLKARIGAARAKHAQLAEALVAEAVA